ncbi:unnamed protein product [Schistosoma margrebowiei]|uniref:Uncharacterized protein n=1 Tax=Schistosoma margrebowiei TaxID=48269 RepID=A0A183MVQ5_9TREM|nr:unnamed protein product [Schistosoma margrebowiei]
MVVGGSRQETLDLGFVLLGTRQQFDLLFFNEIPNKFEQNILEESNHGYVILDVICLQNLFVSCGKRGQYES